MSSDTAAALGEMLHDQIREQDAMEQAFRKQQAKSLEQIEAVRDDLIAGYLKKRQASEQQFPPEVLQIAQVLVAQPRLIQPTAVFVQRLVARINEAVEDVISDLLKDEEAGSPPPTSG